MCNILCTIRYCWNTVKLDSVQCIASDMKADLHSTTRGSRESLISTTSVSLKELSKLLRQDTIHGDNTPAHFQPPAVTRHCSPLHQWAPHHWNVSTIYIQVDSLIIATWNRCPEYLSLLWHLWMGWTKVTRRMWQGAQPSCPSLSPCPA